MLLNCGVGEDSWESLERSNQSIPKEISPGCSLEGLMLKLKLRYFSQVMRKADSFEKTLMLGKIEGGRRRRWQGWAGWMASLTQWTWVWASSGRLWRTGKPGVLQPMGSQRVGHDWATELNWGFKPSHELDQITFSAVILIPLNLLLSLDPIMGKSYWGMHVKQHMVASKHTLFGSNSVFCFN